MALPPFRPEPPRRRKALAWILIALLLLGSLFLILANLESLERLLRGVPDNGWAFSATQADRLLAMGLSGAGVIVCVVDSGVDLNHPDLQGVRVAAWKDLVRGEAEPYDDNGHGTFMVGLIAGRGLVRGFAPQASLVVVKAIDARGEGAGSDVILALNFCMDPYGNGTRSHVISLSLGGSGGPRGGEGVAGRVQVAVDMGILVVAAVGNEGPDAPGGVQRPASEELVVAVGSVNARLEVSSFSQGGNNSAGCGANCKPEVVAPGEGLATTGRGGTYASVSGTSAASAIVSAILALVLEGEPTLQNLTSAFGVAGVKVALMDTALPLDGQTRPHDRLAGYGLIRGLDLLEALKLGG